MRLTGVDDMALKAIYRIAAVVAFIHPTTLLEVEDRGLEWKDAIEAKKVFFHSIELAVTEKSCHDSRRDFSQSTVSNDSQRKHNEIIDAESNYEMLNLEEPFHDLFDTPPSVERRAQKRKLAEKIESIEQGRARLRGHSIFSLVEVPWQSSRSLRATPVIDKLFKAVQMILCPAIMTWTSKRQLRSLLPVLLKSVLATANI